MDTLGVSRKGVASAIEKPGIYGREKTDIGRKVDSGKFLYSHPMTVTGIHILDFTLP